MNKKHIITLMYIMTIVVILSGCFNSVEDEESVNKSSEIEVATSPFVGEWYCNSCDSCNGGSVSLTITQDGDILNFARDMRMSTQSASSNIEFSLKIPEGNELDAPNIKGTYVITDTVLYEIFDNGKQNKLKSKKIDKGEVYKESYSKNKITEQSTTFSSTSTSSTVSLPYEGMSESMIGNTSLGKPTVTEKCRDFYKLRASHRYTTYKWYKNGVQDLAHLQASATVWYWDYKNKKEVDGYIHSVTIYRK